jgi:ATP-dependent Clp protease protease subunit
MKYTAWVDIFSHMHKQRTVFVGEAVTDSVANQMVALLLYLDRVDKTLEKGKHVAKPIRMYFNSIGGIRSSGLAVLDTMENCSSELWTYNLGACGQVSSILVAGGTPGRRVAVPNALFAMQNPILAGPQVAKRMQASEVKVEVEQVLKEKRLMLEGISRATGRSLTKLELDFRRDFYLDAEEALDYGLIDKILPTDEQVQELRREKQGFGSEPIQPRKQLNL